MFISTIHGLLDETTLKRVISALAVAEFTSGRISGGTADTKFNQEVPGDDPNYLDALRLVEGAVRDSEDFNFAAFPRFMTRPIFSRYLEGMSYSAHTDFPLMNFYSPGPKPSHRHLAPLGMNYVRTDLSMTLFLSDPTTYEGGELTFIDERGDRLFKLPAGSAVLYPTGARHGVRLVTSGIRMASIFWIQSVFPVDTQRESMHKLYNLNKNLGEFNKSPELRAISEDIFFSLFKSLAEV